MANGTRFTEQAFQTGRRIEECRKLRGLSRSELVERIEALPDNNGKERSEKQIGYLENGTRTLSREYAELIAQALQVRVEYLLLKDDYKTESERSLSEFSDFNTEWKQRLHAVRTLAFLAGYEIDLFDDTSPTHSVDVWLDAISTGYLIKKDGNIIGTCPLERFNLLALDIQELTEQRIRSYLREVSDNG